jgi:YidC/Oxa1 family membrane protein insertase
MIALFNTLLYQPILNALIFLYDFLPGQDMGFAIVILTIIIKAVLFPFNWKALKAQKALQEIQPQIDELKTKFKDDKEGLAKATMTLYKEQKVNPLSSCLPLLIQFPFLIAVYQAFRTGLQSNDFNMLYSFVPNPGQVDTVSLGLINLAIPNVLLALLAGIAQFIQTKMLYSKQPAKKINASKDEALLANMNKSMLYFMPVMTVVIGLSLPAGLTLYWFITTVLTIIQQYFQFKKKKVSEIIESKPLPKQA